LFLFGCSSTHYSYYDGARYLENAGKQIEHDKLSRAQQNINKAKKCHSGYCGNGSITRHSRINILQSKVYFKQNKYKEALNELDSIWGCEFGADCRTRDSLKIENLFQIHGNDLVKKEFQKIINDTLDKKDDFYSDNAIFLNGLKYTFHFTATPNKYSHLPEMTTFKIIAKDEPFYKLLNLP
tara:strand:+ start:72 stop:617 length:546 start_codon:yes stop_codon:yes gene_type:complete